MAVPSNRSPSPLSSRRIPQSRNSDSSNSAAPRRSFNGNNFPRPSVISNPRNLNPVTPANSPAGLGRRNSLGSLQGWEEKENEKDQTPKLVEVAKSPANGSKNFMAPTISAASKFTPSPRKKVLVERNDPVRTSITLSEGKATFFSEISSEIVEDLDQNDGKVHTDSSFSNLDQKKEAVLEVPRVSKTSKRVTFLEGPSGSAGLKPEKADISCDGYGGVDSASKNSVSCFPVSPIIAPLDADPSIPPYDPKTNFLSPRPQFLLYKPNPRVEVLINKEDEHELGKPKRLEDNFMLDLLSENFSDSDGTEGSNSEDSQKGCEHLSSSENSLPEGTEGVLHVPESLNISSHATPEDKGEKLRSTAAISHGVSEENLEQEKTSEEVILSQDMTEEVVVYDIGKPKPRFSKILKFATLLLVLVVACVSMRGDFVPSKDTSILDGLKSPKLPDASEIRLLTKINFDQLGERFQKVSLESMSHLSVLISKFGTRDNLGHVQFMNLTDLEDDHVFSITIRDQEQQSLQLIEEEDVEEEQSETESIEEPTYPEVVYDDSDDASELETSEELVIAPANPAEISMSQTSETFWDIEQAYSDVDTQLKSQEEDSVHDDAVALLSAVPDLIFEEKTVPERIEINNFEVNAKPDSVAQFESSSAEVTVPESTNGDSGSVVEDNASSEVMLQDSSSQILESPVALSENEEPVLSAGGIAALIFALVSAVAFIYWKQKKASNPNVVVVHGKDGLLSVASLIPVSSAAPKKMFQYRPVAAHQSCATDFDVEEESCSSEMSSFQRSSSYSRKDSMRGGGAAADEVIQSQEDRKSRKYSNKRESLASSSEFSMGASPSYGSFTTYERVPTKHASGDEEIITPVRRSSRIRKQVTSP